MSDISTVATRMAEAAGGLLDALTPEQRQKATLSFEDEAERLTWFYTPTPRVGLRLNEMAPRQIQKVMQLLAAALSEPGYNVVSTVMGLENIVDYRAHFPDRTYGNLEGTRLRDPGNYFVAVFGAPGGAGPWSWRIGGHHVALHFTVRDGAVSPTPAFFGSEPHYTNLPGGQLLRPLAAEEDLARELLAMLDPDQRKVAILSPAPPTDIVQTNRPKVEDGALNVSTGGGPGGSALREQLGLTSEMEEALRYSTTPKGLPADAMTPAQRDVFTRLVRVYLERVADPIAEQYVASLLDRSQLGRSTFAWAGPEQRFGPHYYRVQGERLLIEYDCTQTGANHTHTVWRDPAGDFGEDILAQHLAGERQ
jgi:hypothetical protein